MFDAAYEGLDWAPGGVARGALAHQFTAHTILLICEFKCDEIYHIQGCGGTSEVVKATVVDHEVHITVAERRGLVIVCARILARAQQEEEAQDEHIGDGVGLRGICNAAQFSCAGDDGEGDGFDT